MQDEQLAGQSVGLGVRAAQERADLAPGEALDGLAELRHRRVLEEQPGLAQAPVLSQAGKVALRGCQRVLQDRDDDVVSGPVRADRRRAAPEKVLVEADHLSRDGDDNGTLLLVMYGRGSHELPFRPPLGSAARKVEETEAPHGQMLRLEGYRDREATRYARPARGIGQLCGTQEEMTIEEHAESPRETDRAVLQAVAGEMVRLFKDQFGRGPTRVRADWAGRDTLVVILEDTLTPAER